MWDSAEPLAMDLEQKAQLESWVRARSTPQKIVLRSRICLLAHAGHGNRQIALQLNTSRPTVLLWRDRFAAAGVAGLEHEPPRKASSQRLEDGLIKKIVDTTLQTTPPAATHWSTRTLEHFHKRYSFTKTGRWGKVWPCERSLFQSANESSTFTNRAKAPLKLLSSPVSVWRPCAECVNTSRPGAPWNRKPTCADARRC